MDFLSKARISIDMSTNKVKLGKSKLATSRTYPVYPVKIITSPPKSETLVILTLPGTFSWGLIEESIRLPENVTLMKGIVTSKTENTFTAVFANFHHFLVWRDPGVSLTGKISRLPEQPRCLYA